MKKFLITIDGPAGAGKTTVSKRLAARLGLEYIDTGALYRAVAFEALSGCISLDDAGAIEKLCSDISIHLKTDGQGNLKIYSGEIDLTSFVRTPEVSMAASKIAAFPAVRAFLLELQKSLGRQKNAVFEGRDMGTVVFPDADLKFFLDADIETRALRRFMETKDGHSMEKIRDDIKKRDENDRSRKTAPLKKADDAIYIDSTGLSVDDVVEIMAGEALRTR